MEIKRAVITVFAAGALILAAACGTTHTTTTTTTTVPNSSGSYGSSSTSTSSTTTTTSAPAPVVVTENGQAAGTTTTLANGSTVTRLDTTTIVYPDGTTKTIDNSNSAGMASSTSDNTANLPPGAKVVTRTVTTITIPPNQTVVTTPSMASASTITAPSTTYVPVPTPYPLYNSGRRIPGLDFLVFANRASFNQSNSFPGTLNTGDIRTDIRNQTGYGLGLNAWFNRHFSGELTASRIHPQTSFIPSNAAVNPITGLRVKMTPITGTLQLHFNPYSVVDAYFGGGAAYVLFKADKNFNAGTSGLTSVNFRDEWGPLVNGGLGFNVSRHFGINLDAKYMWVRARANTTFDTATIGNVGNSNRIGVNPFIISAGLRFGF